MKTKLLTLLIFSIQLVTAQTYYQEALLYSRWGVSGTTRTMGMGGAFGAIGADMGSININPAGLGLYRSSDYSVSLGLQVNNNEASFLGSNTTQRLPRVYFQQGGAVWTSFIKAAAPKNEISFTSPVKLRTLSFAINYQRQSFFSRNTSFSGFNPYYSSIDVYVDYLNIDHHPINYNSDPIDLILAHEAGLIGFDTTTGNYTSAVKAPLTQSGTVQTRGGMDQLSIAFGGNVDDKLYFGLGIGIPILTYSRAATFNEYDSQDSAGYFNNYQIESNLKVTGYGINTTFGLIYRPASWMRIGLSYQIPSFMRLNEAYGSTIYYSLDTGIQYPVSVQSSFKYNYRMPMKGTLSAGFFFKQYGFLSVDYELQNMGKSHFNFGSDYTDVSNAENNFLKNNYTFTHTVRAGVEGAIKGLRLRAGYAYSTSPYKSSFDTKGQRAEQHTATAGIGYRGKKVYVDFAYLFGITKDAILDLNTDVVKNTLTSHRAVITIGWRANKNNQQ